MTDTFQLDTTGAVRVATAFVGRDPDSLTRDRPVMVGGPVQWGNLSPFTQGYIEALFATFYSLNRLRSYFGFADLAPETLARIIADCEAHTWAKTNPTVVTGRAFWLGRNKFDGAFINFPPLTVTLGDDGKVRFA